MLFHIYNRAGLPCWKKDAPNAAAALAYATKTHGRGAAVSPADAEAAAEQWRHERRAKRYDRFTREETAGQQ